MPGTKFDLKKLDKSKFKSVQNYINGLGINSPDVTAIRDTDFPFPTIDDSISYTQDTANLSLNRLNRYFTCEEMDQHSRLHSVLDILAVEATQIDNNDKNVYVISDDEEVVSELEILLYNILNIKVEGYNIVRNFCKYGDKFDLIVFKEKAGVLGLFELPAARTFRIEENGNLLAFLYAGEDMITAQTGGEILYDPFSVIHWRIKEGESAYKPYGSPILDAARRHFNRIKLLEDSCVVNQIIRAANRLVFYIGIAKDRSTADAMKDLENMRNAYRKRSFINARTGEIDYQAALLSPMDDIFIARRDGRPETHIDTLQGTSNDNIQEILDYFWDQIYSYVKVPRIYMNDKEGGPTERRENLSQINLYFAKIIEQIQMSFIEGLTKICMVHLLLKGFSAEKVTSFTLEAARAQHIKEKVEQELEESRLSLLGNLVNNGFSRKVALMKVYKISEDAAETIIKEKEEDKYVEGREDVDVEAYKIARSEILAEELKTNLLKFNDPIAAINHIFETKVHLEKPEIEGEMHTDDTSSGFNPPSTFGDSFESSLGSSGDMFGKDVAELSPPAPPSKPEGGGESVESTVNNILDSIQHKYIINKRLDEQSELKKKMRKIMKELREQSSSRLRGISPSVLVIRQELTPLFDYDEPNNKLLTEYNRKLNDRYASSDKVYLSWQKEKNEYKEEVKRINEEKKRQLEYARDELISDNIIRLVENFKRGKI